VVALPSGEIINELMTSHRNSGMHLERTKDVWAISRNNPRKIVSLLQWALEMFRCSRMAETYATD